MTDQIDNRSIVEGTIEEVQHQLERIRVFIEDDAKALRRNEKLIEDLEVTLDQNSNPERAYLILTEARGWLRRSRRTVADLKSEINESILRSSKSEEEMSDIRLKEGVHGLEAITHELVELENSHRRFLDRLRDVRNEVVTIASLKVDRRSLLLSYVATIIAVISISFALYSLS